MDRLKRFQTPLIIGAGLLVFAIAIFVALISPQGSKLSKLRAQESQLQAQQQHLQVEIATLRREKAQMTTNCAELTKALGEVPGTPSVDSFLQQVTALAVASGDPNTPTISVTQAPTSAAAAAVTSVTVSLTLQGTYGQMSAFLKGLDSFPRLFTVTSVSVSGGPIAAGGGALNPAQSGYSLNLSGLIYYSLGQQNPCDTATAPSSSTTAP